MKTTRRKLLKYAGGTAFLAAAPAILTTSSRAQTNKRIAMIVKNLGNSYFDACANGAKEAADGTRRHRDHLHGFGQADRRRADRGHRCADRAEGRRHHRFSQ